jgi:hypothetical protein
VATAAATCRSAAALLLLPAEFVTPDLLQTLVCLLLHLQLLGVAHNLLVAAAAAAADTAADPGLILAAAAAAAGGGGGGVWLAACACNTLNRRRVMPQHKQQVLWYLQVRLLHQQLKIVWS